MFKWRELGGTGTGCLFQFTYCDQDRVEGTQNTDSHTTTRTQLKQRNPLSIPQRNGCKTRKDTKI